ncbi:MAG TPA: hypothetical protein VJV79_32595 [Polyangiaceae bacterium]|nr:hypothetical protein [Polyangiaceae bacterium]
MDSPTGLDDEHDFFGSYDAEQAGQSPAPLDFDDADTRPLTQEQLAHLTRFRRPVAGVLASMTLLSLVALGKYGSVQHDSQRELVAHYGSAIAAHTPATTITTGAGKQPAIVSETSALVPEALFALLADAWSAFVPEASTAANAAAGAPSVSQLSGHVHEARSQNATLSEPSMQADWARVGAFISALSQTCPR